MTSTLSTSTWFLGASIVILAVLAVVAFRSLSSSMARLGKEVAMVGFAVADPSTDDSNQVGARGRGDTGNSYLTESTDSEEGYVPSLPKKEDTFMANTSMYSDDGGTAAIPLEAKVANILRENARSANPDYDSVKASLESASFNSRSVGDESSSKRKATVRELYAPPGPLGVVIYQDESGGAVRVHEIRDLSPMMGLMRPGDKITSVNGVSVAGLNASEVGKVLASTQGTERFLGVVGGGGVSALTSTKSSI